MKELEQLTRTVRIFKSFEKVFIKSHSKSNVFIFNKVTFDNFNLFCKIELGSITGLINKMESVLQE